MKHFKIEALVTRLDGQVIQVDGINDCYSECQIVIDDKYLTDQDILDFNRHISDDYANKVLKEVRTNKRLLKTGEAKDLCCKLSRISVDIEQISVDL